VIVIGKDLLGAGNIARSSLEVDGIGSQVDIDLQAVFKQAQIFIPRAEQSLDVRADLNALLHLDFGVGALPPGLWMLNCLCGGTVFIRPRHCHRRRAGPSPLVDKVFLWVKVEPAEGARPEVQATAITVKVTPARGQESMASEKRR